MERVKSEIDLISQDYLYVAHVCGGRQAGAVRPSQGAVPASVSRACMNVAHIDWIKFAVRHGESMENIALWVSELQNFRNML